MCSRATYVLRDFKKTSPLVSVGATLNPMSINIWISEIIHLISFIDGMFLLGVVREIQVLNSVYALCCKWIKSLKKKKKKSVLFSFLLTLPLAVFSQRTVRYNVMLPSLTFHLFCILRRWYLHRFAKAIWNLWVQVKDWNFTCSFSRTIATNFGTSWSSSKAARTKICLQLHHIDYLLLAFLSKREKEK